MRTGLTALLALPLSLGLALAANAGTTTHKHGATMSHRVTAEVVAVDATGHTLTYRAGGDEHTATVLGKATSLLPSLQAGQKITLTIRSDQAGERITSIRRSTAKTS